MAIDISNISYINYLWTKKNSDGTLTGIRLSKDNLPTDTVYSSSLNSKVNKSGDTMTGNLTPATNKGASLGTSSLYWNNIYGTTIYENGTSLANKYASKTNIPEAYLTWGGKNFSGSYGPIDAAMVPELGANRLAFMPADAVTIEYSRDGGSTWTDYGPTDPQKIDLFNGRGSSFTIGKATKGEGNIATNKYQLRVNIYTSTGHVYTVLNKFVIYLSTSGTNNNWCTIRARKQSDYTAGNDTWTTFADKISVSGWSGYNVINTSGITTYGNTASSQYGHIQFIFGCDTGSTNNSYPGLTITKIFGFGGVGWTTPSTMAKTGHMYTYDSSQNVTFPAAITSGTINSYNILPRGNNSYNLGSDNSKWANVYATTIYENGKTLSSKYIAKPLLTTKGDMIYASGTSNPDRLGIGSNGQFLSIANGVPKWVNNPNSDTHYTNYLQINGNGAEAVKFTQNADKSLNLKPGNNVSISAASGEITISATVPNKSSWNYDDTYVKYSAAQQLNNTQKAQARTNIGAGTITEIKVNGASKGTNGSVNLTNMVTFASSQTATVAGTSKTTYTYNQPTGDGNTGSSNGSAYFPEGIIMGGTAASAGLVTRGICGVTTPDATTGACTKENLYINYDGDNNNNPNGRGLVINAGSAGSDLGNGIYSYCAVRGDAMKAYCDNHYATKAELNTTNTNVSTNATNITTLQGYFSNGIAKKATADKNGKDITTEYVHAKVEAGPETQRRSSTISHQTTPSDARVGIYAEDGNYGGGSVYASTYGTVLNYTASGGQNSCALELTETGATLEFDESGTKYPIITTKDTAGFEDILKGITGRTQVEWNALNKGEYGSNSTYNGTTLPPVILENNSAFWNSASGKPLDVSFHFTKKEKITKLQVKCPPYSGVNPTMTVYYAQNGDTGLTLYKEIATISTADRKAYEFNEEGISADYWVVRFTSSGWIDLRLCSPSGLFTTGLYTEECHQQIMDRFNGYQPVGNYASKAELNTTNTNVSTNATNITTLQGYFSNGIAKRAAADGNGKGITTEYVHTRVDGGISPNEMHSEIEHRTDESGASVYIGAWNDGTRRGGSVSTSIDRVDLYYTSDGQESCALKLTETGAKLEFNENGTEYPIITTKDIATANNVGVIKAAAVRTSAITTNQGGTTSDRYYGVELDSNGKAFVNVPWTDNNTTYSAGTGLSLSGTTFSANTSLGLINSSSANVFDIYRLSSSSYRLKIIRGSHTFSFDSATGFPGGSITFPNNTSMPSSNYHVIAWSSAQGNVDVYQIKTYSKATTGFQMVTRAYSSTKSFSVEYLAICTV